MTAIEYIRNVMKRVRKKESAMVLASQNIDDFLIPEVRELTKPLFAIPTHQFLFNVGNIEPMAYTDTLQLELSEFSLIRYPERGSCLYCCGNDNVESRKSRKCADSLWQKYFLDNKMINN